MNLFKLCLSTFFLLFASVALAHGGIKVTTTPSDNAMLMEAPSSLSLAYSEPLRLLKVSVSGKATGRIAVNFKPSGEKQSEYNVALPSLSADTYTVEWIAMSSDGHKMKESFSFMVH